jgi:hypothetical protein
LNQVAVVISAVVAHQGTTDMGIRIKDLTKPQQKLWRLARNYARAEMNFAEADYARRSTGDSSGMDQEEAKRSRAAFRLFHAIKDAQIVDFHE